MTWCDQGKVANGEVSIASISWHGGLTTLRSIAAALRLRSEGYVSSLIRRCSEEFGNDTGSLPNLDTAVGLLRV